MHLTGSALPFLAACLNVSSDDGRSVGQEKKRRCSMASPMAWFSEPVNPHLTQEKRTCPDREIRRIQHSWVAGAEKWALTRLAARTPEWIGPDHLTVLGLVAQIGAGIGYTLAASNKYALL